MKNLFIILSLFTILSCLNHQTEKISDSEKKIIISSIELVDSSYQFNSDLAEKKGLSKKLIKRMNNEIKEVNKGIEEAKKLPNSTIELMNPATLDLDSLFSK